VNGYDFAKMVETFDRRKVSFVSVTQLINTSTSMGRLMLNVLLSFAQFEREIISERTRDKIAAARRKGKWSGGMPLLGYDVDPRGSKLIVNEDEAIKVRTIFELYLEHQSLIATIAELDRRGWINKRWITRKGTERGGRPFNKDSLHCLLTNVTYLGKLRYKNEINEGEHAAIVNGETWQRVQALLGRNGRNGGADARNKFGALLKGILRCVPCGCAMSEAELAEIETTGPNNGSRVTGSGVSDAIARTHDGPTLTFRVVVFGGAFAATLLIAGFLWFASPSENEQVAVATLVTDVDAVLLCDGQPCKGTELRAGKYQLEQGLLNLQFDGGVMVYVEAPARFDAVCDKRVTLHSGRLSANVPPEGIGFTVETPAAEVIDFGTEFSVEVESGASEVHVFEGMVRVLPRSPSGTKTGSAVDLRTSQAVMIDHVSDKMPVEIDLATDRFIRTFDESRRRYSRTVKRLSPVAFYRMAIRDQGLACLPPEYAGVVLTGEGNRPPHARGVFAGGSLRVQADSSGRGGRVDISPPLRTGQFTLAAFVYLESGARNGIVATNIRSNDGNFALGLDENGVLQATIRNRNGDLLSVSGDAAVPLYTWRHVVMTVDGRQFRLYEDGRLVASAVCSPVADSVADVLWFGTNADGQQLWDGRVDEVALFDRAFNDVDVTDLYEAAIEEIKSLE
jgi:hypothetical protein